MSAPLVVEIIASPVACATGVRDSWREAATWVASQLATRFGDAVSVRYFDLFDADCPALPPGARGSSGKIVMVSARQFSVENRN